ncbi:Chaperone protein dnaJ C76 chloroplastic [Bienertia sinuspersici]
MASTSLALNFPSLNSPIITKGQRCSLHEFPKTIYQFTHHQLKHHHHHHRLHTCKAASSSSSSSSSSSLLSIMEYDLYELLGIDSSSDQRQIKKAYRSLQKRCHPDIAGISGHDMAIILNEAYAVLSDPISRYAYDKEQAKQTALRGYTGRPMYSTWQGSETEERAVFVDELKCVGCLKCALLAENTFAIETTYGRARVVAQMVERSDLAALEFLMSKQPRGKVRIGASNTGGARAFDVFSELKIFHKRLEEAATRKSNQDLKYSQLQKDARNSAIQTIRSISNWLYWQSPGSDSSMNLIPTSNNVYSDSIIDKLRDAAAAARIHSILKNRDNAKVLPQATSTDEYWVPSTPVLPPETEDDKLSSHRTRETPSTKGAYKDTWSKTYMKGNVTKRNNPVVSGIPIGLGLVAAITIGLRGGGEAVGGVEGHIGGSFALQTVNSFELQVILAGVTWYLIGAYLVQIVEPLIMRNRMGNDIQ